MQCLGITKKGKQCTKKTLIGSYCSLHVHQEEIDEIPKIPSEMWREIILSIDLRSMASLSLTCRYFHDYVRKWWRKEEYITILKEINGNLIEGNWGYNYRYGLDRNGEIVYIINKKISPYGIDIDSTLFGASKRLLTRIASYKTFIHTVNEMVKNSYSEDKCFSFNKDLDEAVLMYAKTKEACRLIGKIFGTPTSLEEKHLFSHTYIHKPRISLSSGSRIIRIPKDVLRIVANTLRKTYPKFQLSSVPGGILHFSFSGITIY